MSKVQIGFFSFTEVTDPAEHRSYNEWHQLDHMPEQFPLPGVVFGQRWVCTPACQRARQDDASALAPVHYMTLYLMGEPVDVTLEQFWALGRRLRAEGRFHEHRRSRLSGPFALTGVLAAPRVLVSADAVAYRPNRGVYVVVRDNAASSEHESAAAGPRRAEDEELAAALLGAPGVAGVWSFTSDARRAEAHWHPGDKSVTVGFLDADPLTVAGALGPTLRPLIQSGQRPVAFAGPLETVTPWRWDWFDETS
ncbi:MAG TPA: hypothetical protein VN768_00385 [Acidimicrobiales bacterium]|nr:hypothetical protein [Acidimicrobiales bacterium]